jgi:hypothetical protein
MQWPEGHEAVAGLARRAIYNAEKRMQINAKKGKKWHQDPPLFF